jgi:hypothetical protein
LFEKPSEIVEMFSKNFLHQGKFKNSVSEEKIKDGVLFL